MDPYKRKPLPEERRVSGILDEEIWKYPLAHAGYAPDRVFAFDVPTTVLGEFWPRKSSWDVTRRMLEKGMGLSGITAEEIGYKGDTKGILARFGGGDPEKAEDFITLDKGGGPSSNDAARVPSSWV